jgi:hypothetical protein
MALISDENLVISKASRRADTGHTQVGGRGTPHVDGKDPP